MAGKLSRSILKRTGQENKRLGYYGQALELILGYVTSEASDKTEN
jgi:hypothetical protein